GAEGAAGRARNQRKGGDWTHHAPPCAGEVTKGLRQMVNSILCVIKRAAKPHNGLHILAEIRRRPQIQLLWFTPAGASRRLLSPPNRRDSHCAAAKFSIARGLQRKIRRRARRTAGSNGRNPLP